MKVKLWGLGSLVLLCCGFLLSGCGSGYFVKIDGVKLAVSALNENYAAAEPYYVDMGYEFDSDDMRRSLRKFIAGNMIMAEIARADMEMQKWESEIPEVLADIENSKNNDPEWFQMYLDINGLTEQQMVRCLTHFEYVTRDINVTEEEVRQYFVDNLENPAFANELGEKVTARHILVNTEEEAKEVIARLKAGESFAALVEEKSQDPGSISNGGKYEDITRGQMVAEFENAAFSLNPGERSEPIQTTYGFHIIETLEHKPGKTAEDFEEFRSTMETYMLDEAKSVKYDTVYRQLLEAAKIDYAKGYEYLKD
ncbi:MAG: peptidylprolyl isomerase [Gracilibacteraceae bacterium]|jgi:hypothetical protein|nr:peptidylprolyl isomerase [Gracilibacteraceae bacterium]